MSEPFIGEIVMIGFNFAPRGWALCDGQLLSIVQNDALFSLFGTIYGGDGVSTFGLPDLRGRVPIHMGQGAGLSPRQIGQKSGYEQASISVNQLPNHAHAVSLNASPNEGVAEWSDDRYPAATESPVRPYSSGPPDAVMATDAVTADAIGANQTHNNLQPFLIINFAVALAGLYPSYN
jgi:microcystin-dependent protein